MTLRPLQKRFHTHCLVLVRMVKPFFELMTVTVVLWGRFGNSSLTKLLELTSALFPLVLKVPGEIEVTHDVDCCNDNDDHVHNRPDTLLGSLKIGEGIQAGLVQNQGHTVRTRYTFLLFRKIIKVSM